jgi:curved DNA-binding protein CbpA
MERQNFINHYQILNLTPTASAEAIDREFRLLARRYHPDNQATGDRAKFDAIVQAHDVLKDPVLRAQYHEEFRDFLPFGRRASDGFRAETEASAAPGGGADEGTAFFETAGIDRDASIQNNILVLLYFRRRQNPREPGIGDAELERLSGCPPEHLEFHIWYLKHKKWVATGEDGLLAITIDGVDRAAHIYNESANRLLTARA